MRSLLVVGTAIALAACQTLGLSGNPTTDAPTLFKLGCEGISIADGAFKSAAPALVVSGKLTQQAIAMEDSIFKVDQATCANPPTVTVTNADGTTTTTIDYAKLATQLVADASTIYILLAGNMPAAQAQFRQYHPAKK